MEKAEHCREQNTIFQVMNFIRNTGNTESCCQAKNN